MEKTQQRRPLRNLVAGIALLGALCIGVFAYLYMQDTSLRRGFDSVKPGATMVEVSQAMGRPNQIIRKGSGLYSSYWAYYGLVSGIAYHIDFGLDDRVLSTGMGSLREIPAERNEQKKPEAK
jgi:hypothetical protein